MTWKNDSEKFPLTPWGRGNENFYENEEGSVRKNTAFSHAINYVMSLILLQLLWCFPRLREDYSVKQHEVWSSYLHARGSTGLL
jgi:hypothetical protein